MEFDYKKNPEALHESAHATAIWHNGGRLILATISGPLAENQIEQTPCYVCYEPPEVKSLDRFSYDDVYFRVMSCLAPRAVEEKFFGKASAASLYDIQKGIRGLSPGFEHPEARPLVESAQKAINNNGKWEDATKEFYRKHSQPVIDFFNQKTVQDAVAALAEYLAIKGQLTGFEVADFLESIWDGPLPQKVKPASEHSSGLRGGTLGNTLASTSRLIELIHHNLNECVPENSDEEEILEIAFQHVLVALFKIKELESISK